jgi:zinc protease
VFRRIKGIHPPSEGPFRMRFSSIVALASALALQLPASASAAPQLVRTLPNKMTLVVRENRTRPLVAIQVWVKAGSREEQLRERGVTAVLARTLFEATKNREPGKIEEELNLHGGSYGSEAGYAYTLLQVTVPARAFGFGLDVLSDVVLRPRMSAADLVQGIGQTRNESRAVLQSAERASINPVREALHPGNPLSWPLAVSELELAAVTLPIAERFYKAHYVAENMMIVVVGDVDPDDVARRVELAFQGAPKGKAPARGRFTEKALATPQIRAETNPGDTQGAGLTVGFRAPAWGTADALALDVLMAVLVDSPTSRAQKRLAEGGGEFIVAAAERAFQADGGTVTISVRAEPGRMRDAESALFALIEQARSSPVTQEELDAAVRSVLSRDLFFESELWGLGRATAFAFLQGRPGGDEVYFQRIKAIRPTDLVAVANQYLDMKRAAVVEMMPSGTADSLGLREGFEKRIREKMDINEAAYKQGPKVTQSAEQERRQRIDAPLALIPAAPFDAGRSRVDRTTLSGGPRVLTGEDRSIPLVTIGVYMAGGVRYENDKNNGISSMVREVLLSTSDPKAAGAQYRHSLADLGRLVPYQDRDMWGVSVSVPADSWRDALGRLGAMFAHPEIDTVTVDATRLLVLTALDKWLDDDAAQRSRLIFPTKYQVSGYRLPGLGTRRNLISIPLTDVEAWYRKFVVRGNIVVSVFGDVRPADVGPAVDEAFRDLSAKPFQPGTIAKEPEFPEDFREKWELGAGPECTVTLAFSGPPATSPDMPAMYVVNSVLSVPRGWFKQYLESNPFVKNANSIVSQAADESPIIASVTVAGPVSEEDAVKLLFRQFKKVAFLELTAEMADSLRYAKTHAVGSYLSLLNSNTSRAFQSARGEVFGLSVDYPLILPAKIDAVTPDDLLRVGRKYFEIDEFNRRPYAIAETRPGGW